MAAFLVKLVLTKSVIFILRERQIFDDRVMDSFSQLTQLIDHMIMDAIINIIIMINRQ